jgi:FlaA1/EpsC-like NDP-sugar epimerase
MIKYNLNKLANYKKKFFLIFSDFIIIIFSLIASYSLRHEKIYSAFEIDYRVYLLFLCTFYLIFYINNIYQILIRYFDYFSIKKIINSVLWCLIILIPLNFYFYKILYFPRSISFISPILIGIFILLHRIGLNFLINLNTSLKTKKKNILILGFNKPNIELIKNIRQNLNNGEIKALIDTKNLHKKREFNGIKIFKKNELDDVIKNYEINEIIISNKSITNREISNLFDRYKNKNIRIKNLGANQNYLNQYLNQSIISNLNFFDIVNRPKIVVKKEILERKIKRKNILITGAGGSIGSELCLEILKHKPKKLFMLEISEINLFNLVNKLKEKKCNLKLVKPILGDCNDKYFLENYFKSINIDEIYHAAAYKHVNFGEENPYSMIKNNVFATQTIVNFSFKKEIKNFTFISSDKAVKPKSILGITKRFGEKIIQYEYSKYRGNSPTNFTIVRFGNVIGSSGSVIPIFLNQISKNLPLTVTHKKVRRYFMSITEAVQLVINASYMNKADLRIFALNMGEQLFIYKIAERIIRLSGQTVKNSKNKNGDKSIRIIGLKKGEKMSEEISMGENLLKTPHSEIMICDETIDINDLKKDLLKLQNLTFKDMIKLKLI